MLCQDDNMIPDYQFQFKAQKINLFEIKCLKLVEESLETKTDRYVKIKDISLNQLSLLIEKNTKI